MTRLRKFLRLSASDQRLLVEAALFHGMARLALLALPFRWVASILGQNMEETSRKIQTKLQDALGYNVGVFVRTITQIKEIIQSKPFEGMEEESASFLVTFLLEEVKGLETPIRIPNSTADIILKRGKEVYSITRGHGDGGKPNPYIEMKLKTQATTRNWNIINEIAKAQ